MNFLFCCGWHSFVIYLLVGAVYWSRQLRGLLALNNILAFEINNIICYVSLQRICFYVHHVYIYICICTYRPNGTLFNNTFCSVVEKQLKYHTAQVHQKLLVQSALFCIMFYNHPLLINYTPAQWSCWGVLLLSLCLFVHSSIRPSRIPYPLHFIFLHLIKQLQKVCCMYYLKFVALSCLVLTWDLM